VTLETAIAAASAVGVLGCAGALLYEWFATRVPFWLVVLAGSLGSFVWVCLSLVPSW